MEERRASTGKREDRRVRRSKRLLETGLTELLEEKPINAITVRELTERVDINRGTFYLYYRDIYDMVEKLEQEYSERIMEIFSGFQPTEMERVTNGVITSFFQFIKDNKALCRVLLSEHGDIAFLQRLDTSLRAYSRGIWVQEKGMSEEEFDYLYSFVTFGALGIVRDWVRADCDTPVERIAALTDRCLRNGAFPSMLLHA